MPVITVISPDVIFGSATPAMVQVLNGNNVAITITAPGAQVGMRCMVIPRATLDSGIIFQQPPYVSSNNTITIVLYNVKASPITPTAVLMDYWVG